MGLLRAAEEYDGARSKFSYYAAFWIKREIRLHLNQRRFTVRPPMYFVALNNDLASFTGKFTNSDQELSNALQDLNKVIELNPKLPEARFTRAMFYIGMGNIQAARADVTKGEQLGGVCPYQIKMTLDSFPAY